MNNSNPTLKKAYKLLKKIAKKMGNPDLHFSAQIGVDSSRKDNFTTYAAMIAPPREGLAPITFAAFTKEEFLEHLVNFYEDRISPEQLEVAYHEAQIVSNNRSTEWHQSQINDLQKEDDDSVESTTTEDESVKQ